MPSAPPMNSVGSEPMGLPIAAVDTTAPPAGYFHLTAPSAKTPYTNPSAQPTYAVPSSASVGEEKTRPPVLNVHRSMTFVTGPANALRPECAGPFRNIENGALDKPRRGIGGSRRFDSNASATYAAAACSAMRAAHSGTYTSNTGEFSLVYATAPSPKYPSQ